jgi:hypothetical protein
MASSSSHRPSIHSSASYLFYPPGLQTVSKRPPNGLETASKRSPNGLQTDSKRPPNGLQTVSKQPLNGLQTVSKRPPNGLQTVNSGFHGSGGTLYSVSTPASSSQTSVIRTAYDNTTPMRVSYIPNESADLDGIDANHNQGRDLPIVKHYS